MTHAVVKTPVLDLGSKKFYLGSVIGEGTYSKVCLALVTTNNGHEKQIACKIINRRHAGLDFTRKFLPREISILRTVCHPNIITVLDILELQNNVYLFMSYCKYGDLLEYIRSKGSLSEKRTKYFFRQLISAVHYLHDVDVAHRDIKCENILLYSKHSIKLGDFGFARLCRNERTGSRVLSTTFCGSAAYAAPEIIQGSPYNPKMYDIWSMGCVLYIMLTAEMPFDDSNVRKMLKNQQTRTIFMTIYYAMKISLKLKKLLIQLLEPDVMKRATIVQVVESEWLAGHKKHLK